MAVEPGPVAAAALAQTSASFSRVILPALGMADDHGARAGIGQHLGRDVAREGAGLLGVAVLPADGDPRSDGLAREGVDQGRRRADEEIDLGPSPGV